MMRSVARRSSGERLLACKMKQFYKPKMADDDMKFCTQLASTSYQAKSFSTIYLLATSSLVVNNNNLLTISYY
jgi:hypothetical protein